MRETPSISACLIVKDEELHIRRCLRSIVNAVDEICIIDTGCSDRTIEIAEKEFGAKSRFRAWDDDFSAARNASIDLASGDWILQIDADEELYQPDIPKLRPLLERTDVDAINVVLRNFYNVPEAYTGESVRDPMNTPHAINHLARIFRRLPHLRYTGFIHETIREIKVSLVSDISIFHYGYAMHGKVQETRLERNYRLCLKQIDAEPDNPANYYYMGTTCVVWNRIEEAENYFRRAVEIARPEDAQRRHFYQMSLYQLANQHARRQEYDKALALCEQALDDDPHYLDAWIRLGEARFFLGHYWDAERALRRYLEILQEHRSQVRMTQYSLYMLNADDYACFLLGRCAQEREDIEDAERWLLKSIEHKPTWGAYYFLSQVYESMGRAEDAEAAFKKAKELNPELEREKQGPRA